MALRVLLLSALFVLASSIQFEHILVISEDKDFRGETSYMLVRDHNCVPLVPQWQNRVSSINTLRHCYQIYEGRNCDGKEVFMYPMSKHHNDLTALALNDRVNSIRLCLLDERFVDNATAPLDKTKPEYAFWDFTFGTLSPSDQKSFRHLTQKHNYWHIPWTFIPGLKSSVPLPQQYQMALDWMISMVNMSRRFTLQDLAKMRKLAYNVFDYRANRNAERRPVAPLGSRIDAISFQLEIYWKMMVEAIDNETERQLDEQDKTSRLISSRKSLKKTGR